MKKTLIVIGLCAVILSMPTLLAVPALTHPQLFSPLRMSNGTFAGGLGRGHWGNGRFNIDTVYAYMRGVYTAGVYKKISGDLTNSYDQKIGEIRAYLIQKIIIGSLEVNNHRTSIVGFLVRNQNDQFIGRIMGIVGPAPHIWGQFVPNKMTI